MTTLSFFVSGSPVAYQRTRVATSTFGKLRFLTPAESRDWRDQVASVATLEARRQGWKVARGPLTVTVVVHRPIPASTPRKRAATLAGTPCTVRPDVDNYAKLVMDAGAPMVDGKRNPILWEDDAQVWKITAEKRWCEAKDAGVAVTVTCG